MSTPQQQEKFPDDAILLNKRLGGEMEKYGIINKPKKRNGEEKSLIVKQ